MWINKILLGLIVIIAISCDCQIRVSGKVLDFDSKLPIDKVSISEDTTDLDNPYCITYKSGDFEFSHISGICDKVVLYFSKEGYKTQKITIENNKTDTIYLKKN
jgi:hypothetical protein